jgi:5-methyltetrahydrofolate--homocysteine methyltransferase
VGDRGDEILAMQWAVKTLQKKIKKPLCIDSADPEVLDAGLNALDAQGLINSTTAETKSLEPVVSLASDYDTPVIALAMDENGIPETVEGRLNACQKIADACESQEVPLENIYFDPLVIPISTDATQGLVTLDTLAMIKKHFPGAKTVMGLSNVSFGLPARMKINAAFLHMAIHSGLDAALMDPAIEELISAIRTGEAIVGKDRHFRRYTRAYRTIRTEDLALNRAS